MNKRNRNQGRMTGKGAQPGRERNVQHPGTKPRSARQQKERETEQGETDLVLGRKPVLEAVANRPDQIEGVYLQRGRKGPDMERIADLCRENGVRFTWVDKQAMDRLYQGPHQGAAAKVFGAGFVDLSELLRQGRSAPLPVIVALDQVQDPVNAGVLCRTLYGLGGGGLILTKHNSAHLGPSAIKASAGTLHRLPVAMATNLGRTVIEAVDAGYTVYAARKTEEAENLYGMEPVFPAMIVLGNEDKGVRPGVVQKCSGSVAIPLARDLDSLNVAQAGALILGRFLAAAQR